MPKEDWIIVKNVHEPLVDEQTFMLAQEVAKVKRPPNKNKVNHIFAGLLKCGTCGKAMSYQSRNGRTASASYACNTYRRYGKEYCSMHYITYEQIYDIVLQDIQYHASLSENNAEQYIRDLIKKGEVKSNGEKALREKELLKAKSRVAELDTIIQRLYEDNVLGKISDERFTSMSKAYEDEQKMLKSKLASLTEQLRCYEEKQDNATHFIDLIRAYTDIKELDAAMLNALVEKIVIQECEYINGERTQKLEIYYRYVGQITA
ncbi:MAG: DUF4368 domain-containing protein [Eubacteriales bacterium]|nr:DUF4368 domain-containing protein [Eubacteriales bacterium]